MSEFGEPWKLEFQFDGDNLIRQKHWKRGVGVEGIVCGATGSFSGVANTFIPSNEQMSRIVACVNALAGIPTEAVSDPNFKTLLHTLAQYAIKDDVIGQEQTGWVLGQLMDRHISKLDES